MQAEQVAETTDQAPPAEATEVTTQSDSPNGASLTHSPFEDAFARAMAAIDEPDEAGESADEQAEAAPSEEAEVQASESEDKPEEQSEGQEAPAEELQSSQYLRALEELHAQRAEEQRQYQEQLQQLEQQRQELSGLERYKAVHEALESGDKLAAIEAMGVTYNDLTAAALSGEKPAKSPADMRVAELEAKLESFQKQHTEFLETQRRQQQEQERAYHEQQARAVIEREIKDDESFSTLRAFDGWQDEVRAFIANAWEKQGYRGTEPPITVREAAQQLETYLANETINRLKASPALRKQALEILNQSQPTTPVPTANNGQKPQTLTNGQASEVARGGPATTAEDCIARAIAVAEQS